MAKGTSRFRRWREQAKILLDERAARTQTQTSRWRRFVHFWVLVGTGFNRNLCPVRASALSYASLLAMIPMLAVVLSITSSVLKTQGEEQINHFIDQIVASLTPPATNAPAGETMLRQAATTAESSTAGTNGAVVTPAPARTTKQTASGDQGLTPPATNAPAGETTLSQAATATKPSAAGTNGVAVTQAPASATEQTASGDQEASDARKRVAQKINEFIQNTRSGTLGVTGSVVLIFVAISLLSRIEMTFNDIWGVKRGRTWFMRIVLYWGVLTLAPILLVVALGLASGPYLRATQNLVASLPLVGNFLVHLGFLMLPVVVLCLTFSAFYMLMPNTRVHWRAALVGGVVAGCLFDANNLLSVLYVSRVVSYSTIYGSLGLVPVLMVGLYFAWIIVLFGAQVAYEFQNRAINAEAQQAENINQRGREFIALRLMTLVGQRFVRGDPPSSVVEIATELGVPTRLVQQILHTLAGVRLVVETAGPEPGYTPARPIENITCYDVLEAMRAAHGQELATRNEPTRLEVYGEFQRIQQAEREAAASVNMLALINRAQAQLQHGQPAELP